jgi:hypothetical protein
MKPAMEFFPADRIPWAPAGDGRRERILSHDPMSGVASRMLEFEKGTLTDETLTHEFWEEVWILRGSITDLRLGQTFTEGMYACRPPGMPHGPWESRDGCMTFEVRYPAPGARS